MKNLTIIISVIILITAVQTYSKSQGITVNKFDFATIKDKKVFLNVADTEDKKINGLMYVDNIPENEGMLFLFDRSEYKTFWMKNMKIPLDILFINNDKIVKIYNEVPVCRSEPCELYNSRYKINSVIELKNGFCGKYNIKTGDKIKFSHSIQSKRKNFK